MTPEVQREIARKALHMAMGLFAVALRWLTPWQGALCALAALVHNLWLFPHYGYGKLLRPEEKALGYSGMIGYPAVVLVLCLAFPSPGPNLDPVRMASGGPAPHVLWAAAGAWAIMAYGDAFAALAGILLGGPVLPWNRRKRWTGFAAFVFFGAAAAAAVSYFVAYGDLRMSGPGLWNTLCLCGLAALVAALVEGLPGQVDDNLTVPLGAGIVLVFFSRFEWAGFLSRAFTVSRYQPGGPLSGPDLGLWGLLALNLALGLTALGRRWVTPASAWLGILWGTLVAAGCGWEGYGFLLLFYLLANGSTYVGARRKSERGIAESDGGRRGAGSVFSKGLFPALFSLVSPTALVSALAVYAADTVASEIGKLSGGKTWLLWKRRSAKAGEAGGVSLLGSAVGAAVLALFAGLFTASAVLQNGWAGPLPARFHVLFMGSDLARFGVPTAQDAYAAWWPLFGLSVLGAGLVCFFLESVLNEAVVGRGWFSKEVVHLFIGALAGVLPFLMAALVTDPHAFVFLWSAR